MRDTCFWMFYTSFCHIKKNTLGKSLSISIILNGSCLVSEVGELEFTKYNMFLNQHFC